MGPIQPVTGVSRGMRGNWLDGDAGLHDPKWVWARAFRFQDSQVVFPWFKALPEPLPRSLGGHTPGGGVAGLARAQDRVVWDIAGMLRLLKAIEDAEPETPRQRRNRLRAEKGITRSSRPRAYAQWVPSTPHKGPGSAQEPPGAR